MSIIDSKIIETQYGQELYMDQSVKVEADMLQQPEESRPFYGLRIGVEYFLLRDKHFTIEKNYFWILMDQGLKMVSLAETDTESLFAVKSEQERSDTKQLIGDWLIKTDAYKQAILRLIEQYKSENVATEAEIRKIMQANQFLEKLMMLKPENIEQAEVEKEDAILEQAL
ncbi:hypothetical protein LRR81_12310 [Metabacillus sp. GX 13764]|uniref:hypothetical protein n=1 Tax=Metabacillus kandeliae TaxID=2900151 RepID=UPI001E30FAA3|nr:hypothetical protein [Metabacillus kandeliae]MCD7035031.1 hypothetical protein [Metabacillus kandeliae]